jgi:hypothetical protein
MECFAKVWLAIIQMFLWSFGLVSFVFMWLSLKRTPKFNKVGTQHSLLSDLSTIMIKKRAV